MAPHVQEGGACNDSALAGVQDVIRLSHLGVYRRAPSAAFCLSSVIFTAATLTSGRARIRPVSQHAERILIVGARRAAFGLAGGLRSNSVRSHM